MTAAARPLADEPPRPAVPVLVALGTMLAYALIGAVGLLLAGPPGYASPLYPAAGIALAAVLVYGRAALPGVLCGAFAVNAGLGALRGGSGLADLVLPLVIGVGAMLQAGVGAALVRRFVSMPLVLNAPRDILRFGLLGALVACCVSPSVAISALWAAGVLSREMLLPNWFTWWVGDALGVLIAAPLVLTFIGHPRADWQPRRRTLGIPLLLALALVAAGMLELSRLDRQRLQAAFERDADRLVSAAETRLAVPLYALQALHSAMRLRAPDADTLHVAARWWLAQQSSQLLAMGYSERVPLEALPAFEAAARAQGMPDYRVFDRPEGTSRAGDGEVLALRLIEPMEGNRAALGVNVLSIPAARVALNATRASGEPAVTAGFRLTQARGDETGVVIYQALYRGEAAPGETAAARAARFSGVVFVTVPTERALAGLADGQPYLRWCLLDADPQAPRRRLAGPMGCEVSTAAQEGWQTRRELRLAGRAIELHIAAPKGNVPGRSSEAAWLLSTVGMASAAMLGALLLTITGHSRRTELVVTDATAELRREIEERTAAESALRDSEARLRSILDHVPLGVMFLDPQGQIIDCNPQLARMLGATAQDLRGGSVVDLVPAEETERIRRMRRDLLEGASGSLIEMLRLRPFTGPEPVVRVSVSALRGPDGRVLRMVGVVEDITEHLRLLTSERALQRAEAANRAKSEFLSRMSHELRTPLNAMIGFAQLLGLDGKPPLAPHQAEWAQQIQRAGWHLLEMINETLDLARIEGGAVQLTVGPLALQPLVAACAAMLATPAAQRGIRIEQAVAADAGAVLGDAVRLKQVLTNLLSNAVKYNVPQGRVMVAARRVVGPDGDMIEITVADSGLGMTPEQQTALFQPYNRLGRENTDIEGTGIGLVISRRLAELMGGTLDARSRASEGSVFTLRLPAAEVAEAPPVRFTNTSPAPYHRRLVHYVEDNETNVEVMRGIFAQRPQIQLEVSMLGLDGLAAIRASRPDLVLLDMQLPDINGLELLRHLKQDDSVADIPVVVVSADATPIQTQLALTSGAARYVTKPVDVTELLQIVDDLLEAADTRWG
ncbi:MAG: CHASE domain-containing protein [Betaproteobacteria bacterium]|nr:CHASE domain-containing protein [Betaproteobacteria bacterium]